MEGKQVKKSSPNGLLKRILAMVCFSSMLKRAVKKPWLARICCSPPDMRVKEGEEVKLLADEEQIISEEEIFLSSEGIQDYQLNTQGLKEVSKMALQEASQDDNGKRTQGVEVCVTLPEDLVERILAMVPFPYVFKARALSKSWLARFSPIEFEDDEVKKHLASSFQKRVGKWSTNWKTFCPVFIDSLKGFSAYDQASRRWARMPSLSFIPFHLLNNPYLQMDGALLLMSEFYKSESGSRGSSRHELCVANFLTRSLRQLPRPPPLLCAPEKNCTLYFQKLVSQPSLGTYQVVVFYVSRARGYYIAQIYDSRSHAWRSKTLAKNLPGVTSPPAYLNGVLYMVVGENPRDLLTFNVEEGTFEELEILGDIMGKVAVGLVVCSGHLFMLVKESRSDRVGGQVLKIDLGLRTMLEVAQGPAPQHCIHTILSDGDCILFPFCDGPVHSSAHYDGMVVYNMQENKWNSTHFHSKVKSDLPKHRGVYSFQPNLNPFLAV